MSTVSAVQSVRRSGLKLVPQGKCIGRLASAKDLAKMNWKPWKHTAGKPFPPSPETMERHALSARLAYVIMLKSKAALMKVHQDLEHEAMDELMGGLAQATEKFKALASMCDQAYLRILVAGSKHALAGGKFKFQDGSSAPTRASDL
jgi:hypothetical protein